MTLKHQQNRAQPNRASANASISHPPRRPRAHLADEEALVLVCIRQQAGVVAASATGSALPLAAAAAAPLIRQVCLLLLLLQRRPRYRGQQKLMLARLLRPTPQGGWERHGGALCRRRRQVRSQGARCADRVPRSAF